MGHTILGGNSEVIEVYILYESFEQCFHSVRKPLRKIQNMLSKYSLSFPSLSPTPLFFSTLSHSHPLSSLLLPDPPLFSFPSLSFHSCVTIIYIECNKKWSILSRWLIIKYWEYSEFNYSVHLSCHGFWTAQVRQHCTWAPTAAKPISDMWVHIY